MCVVTSASAAEEEKEKECIEEESSQLDWRVDVKSVNNNESP